MEAINSDNNVPMMSVPAVDQSYKSYIGTKIIRAYPCPRSTADGDVPGYNVKYSDGYESWSPKEQFEIAYRLITPDEKKSIFQ